jgi:hypothetical protein
MSPLKYGSIAVTFRPRHGVDNKLEAAIMKYVKKQDYALVVAEKEDHERHFHIQLWWDIPREIGTITRWAVRCQSANDPTWDHASESLLKKGIKHCYNDDFMDNYLSADNPDKLGDAREVLYKRIPKDTRPHYPSQEDQDKALIIKHAKDKQFAKMAIEFAQWFEDPSNKKTKSTDEIYDGSPSHWDVARYLSYRMFDARDMYVLKGKKQKMELCQSLYFYITGSTHESVKSFMCVKSATKEQDACGFET